MWTKRGVGHGAGHGLPYGLPYGPPYCLPVVIFFFKTRLSIAVNQCVNNMLHQSDISTTLFCPLGGISRKFSKQTSGRSESEKPECPINTHSDYQTKSSYYSTSREFQRARLFRGD